MEVVVGADAAGAVPYSSFFTADEASAACASAGNPGMMTQKINTVMTIKKKIFARR